MSRCKLILDQKYDYAKKQIKQIIDKYDSRDHLYWNSSCIPFPFCFFNIVRHVRLILAYENVCIFCVLQFYAVGFYYKYDSIEDIHHRNWCAVNFLSYFIKTNILFSAVGHVQSILGLNHVYKIKCCRLNDNSRSLVLYSLF